MANKKQGKPMSVRTFVTIMISTSVLVLIGAFFAGNALLGQLIQQGKVQSAKSKASNQLDKNVAAAPTLIRNYQALGANALLVSDAMPNYPDYPSLLSMWEAISKDSGLSLHGISPSQALVSTISTSSDSSENPIMGAGMSVSLTGSYDSFLRLLADIERSSRALRVTDVQLNGSGSTLAIQMSVTAYYQADAKVPFKEEAVK